MSDFELITIYTEQVSLFFTVITVLTTILFSFLASMYFVAPKLSRSFLIALSALFSLVSFGLTGAVLASGRRAASIGEQIVTRISLEGSQISWLYPGVMPRNIGQAFFYFFMVAIALGLLFVFVRRREKGNPG